MVLEKGAKEALGSTKEGISEIKDDLDPNEGLAMRVCRAEKTWLGLVVSYNWDVGFVLSDVWGRLNSY